jgi:LmbE family N-acetylglucosaminyl deacetylase
MSTGGQGPLASTSTERTSNMDAAVGSAHLGGEPLAANQTHQTPAAQCERILERAALVVCHPDDEILWFASIIGHISSVIIAFLENRFSSVTQGRIRSLAAHPKPGVVCLGLAEARVFGLDKPGSKLAPYGIEISNPELSILYQANYDRLVDLLRPLLKDRRNVFTHSPWGEYGHPEHIQMYCAVSRLQQDLGFRLWFPNYVSRRAGRLRSALGSSVRVVEDAKLPTDLELTRRIQQLYVQNNCWTWYSSYRWPRAEEFLAQDADSTGSKTPSQYPPILLNERLGPADRFRWMRAANARTLEASWAGRFLSRLAARIRRSGS